MNTFGLTYVASVTTLINVIATVWKLRILEPES